jgi:hypothetical protein
MVLYDNPDVSIIKGMQDRYLLSLTHLYSYDTVSKYTEKMYEEVHYIPMYYERRQENFGLFTLEEKVKWYNTLKKFSKRDCRVQSIKDESSDE